jgi:hypothetical protein
VAVDEDVDADASKANKYLQTSIRMQVSHSEVNILKQTACALFFCEFGVREVPGSNPDGPTSLFNQMGRFSRLPQTTVDEFVDTKFKRTFHDLTFLLHTRFMPARL